MNYNLRFLVKYFSACTLILFLAGGIESLQGQTRDFSFEPLRIKYYTPNEGHSLEIVNDLLHDSFGFTWVAAESGLQRFDGTNFIQYKSKAFDPSSISGEVINVLCEDNRSNLWIGTLGNGLNRYNRQDNNFTRVKLDSSSESESISDIVEDSKYRLWVSTRNSGLFRLNNSDLKLDPNHYTKYLEDIELAGLHIDKNQVLWIGGRNGELYRMDIDSENPTVPQKTLQLEGAIHAIYDKEPFLLLGLDNGIFLFDTHTGMSKKVNTYLKNHEIGHVSSFLMENEDEVWVGTGNGLFLYNWKKGNIDIALANNDKHQLKLSTNTVLGLNRISDDKILVGTTNGFNILDFSEPFFFNISKDRRGQHLLNDNIVLTILKEEDRLWVGTADGGVNLIEKEKSYHLIENELYPKELKGGYIMEIKKDSINNRIWIATTRGLGMIELSDFNPDYPEIKLFRHDETDDNTISMDYLTSITIDKKGGVWGSTYGQGLFYLHNLVGDSINIIRFKKNAFEASGSLPNNFLYGSILADDNTLWVATEGGLSRLSFTDLKVKNSRFKNFYADNKDSTSLSHNSIVSFIIDSKSRLWIGTRSGLNRYQGNGKFVNFNKDPRLQGSIFTMQAGNDGDIWLGSNNGIFYYSNVTEEFDQFTENDGLHGNIIGLNASYKDSQGNLYFGGPLGLTYFSGDRILKKDYNTRLYFSGLRVKNEKFPFIYDTTEESRFTDFDEPTLKFEHDEFPFYINVSKIDYNYHQGLKYGFKLLPYDGDWNVIEESEIQFLNLPNGEYTLQVNGFNRGRPLSQPPIELKLKILPPYWASWWAYSLYAIILGTLGYILYKFNLNRKLAIADSQRAREMDDIKSKMYADISHEFRTPLTIIKGLSGQLIRKQRDPSQLKIIKDIDRSNDQLLVLVNQMLDLASLDSNKMQITYKNGDIVSFIGKCLDLYRSYSDSKKLTLEFNSDVKELYMDFDDDKLQKIVNNLVSNAIKFTPEGGKIKIGITTIKDTIKIQVADTGSGITNMDLCKVFDRHYKTEDLYGSYGNGIGLALTKELVGLLNGTISVWSELGEGSVFTVTLPINNSAVNTSIDYSFPFINKTGQTLDFTVPAHNIKKPTLLVVEDNKDIQHFLTILFAEHYNLITADNGIEGLKKAAINDIDFILSDVMMPQMDGFEFCQEIKADVNTSHIPFIMLSARTSSADKLRAYQLGVDAYMTKPFNQDELLQIIKNLLEKRKKRIKYLNEILSLKSDSPRSLQINQLDLDLIKNIQEYALSGKKDSMETLAQNLGTSRTQLHRKLKQITGRSITEYINHVRIEKAKILLLESSLNINEIAYEVGYDSPNYFIRKFKKVEGKTPQSYRLSEV